SKPEETDGEVLPLFQADLDAWPARTPAIRLGGTSLWTEHHAIGGNGTATLIAIDPDHGGETESGTLSFNVASGGPVVTSVSVGPEGEPLETEPEVGLLGSDTVKPEGEEEEVEEEEVEEEWWRPSSTPGARSATRSGVRTSGTGGSSTPATST